MTAIYQYQTGNGEWINGTTPLTLDTSEFGKFSCEQYIVGDTGNGFNISNSYKIKVIVSDKLSSKPNTKELIAGEPAIAVFKNNIALHNKYDESRSDIPIQLYGKTGINGDLIINEKMVYENYSYVSEEEILIGRWKNGKNLYRKTYVIDIGTATSYNFDISDLNPDEIMINDNYSFFITEQNYQLQFGYYSSENDWSRIYIRSPKIYLQLGSTYSGITKVATITVEYTKITDEVE